MTTIDITTLIGPDLKSRTAVADLLVYVQSLQDENVIIDFSGVKFATRSFIDEYYNTFIDDHGKLAGLKVEAINIPADIKYMLNVVSKTQKGKKLYEEPENTTTRRFSTVKELTDYLQGLCL